MLKKHDYKNIISSNVFIFLVWQSNSHKLEELLSYFLFVLKIIFYFYKPNKL